MAQMFVSSRVGGMRMVLSMALAMHFGAEMSFARKVSVMPRVAEEAGTAAAADAMVLLPPHMAKYAAFGEDLASFIRNAEKNSGAFMEANATTAETATGKTVSQQTFCPKPWRKFLGQAGKYVGGGAFGKVYVAKLVCDPSTMMAIKVQKKTRDTGKEARLMEGMDHPFVVKAFQHADGPKAGQFSLLMEAASGGDLENVARLAEGQKARLLYETFLGVGYMHGKRLVHADLKLENVMLSEKCGSKGDRCHSKVCDLGLTCSTATSGDCNGIAGTPIYMSPGLVTAGKRTQPDDLWALGVMTHQLTKGGYPSFLNKAFRSIDELIQAISKLRGKSNYRAKNDSPKEKLIEGLLQGSSSNRLTWDGAAALAKKWALAEGVTEEALSGGAKSRMPCWEEKAAAAEEEMDAKTSAAAAAGDAEQNGLVEVMIHKGVKGKLGFRTETGGPTVIDVTAGGNAEQAGLEVGDVIETLQHRPWGSMNVDQRLRIIKYETDITLEVRRG